MRITILCTDENHPVVVHLRRWRAEVTAGGHEAVLVHDRSQVTDGDILFLVSCSQKIDALTRARFRASLVLHASNLPQGRGWSPHVWAIVRGADEITVCLLEAVDQVDAGRIWFRRSFRLEGHELLPEINDILFRNELDLMSAAVNEFANVAPVPQSGEPGEYLRKRTPDDSRLDPHKSIAEQFNLLRVVDSTRYPAFVDFRGHRYILRIEKDRGDHE